MLRKYYTYFLVLTLLMYFNISKGQVYAPDTTFKLNLTPEIGAKINFLHKINDSSFFVGTNIYDDYGKPFIKNLYVLNTNGEILDTYKSINSYLISANLDQILLSNIDGTFLFKNQKLSFIDKRKVIDVNWASQNILLNESGALIIGFNGNIKFKNNIPIGYSNYDLNSTFFWDTKTIATYEQNKLTIFDFNGVQLTFPKEYQFPFLGSYMNDKEIFRINKSFVGVNSFDYFFQNYRNIITILDSTGKIIANRTINSKFYSKIIENKDKNLILRTQSCYNCGSSYSFLNKNLEVIKNKTLFGENYRQIIAFDDFFLATDGNKIVKLSTKNSKYIEALLPDTLTVNENPIKILAKTVGSNEAVNISCDCEIIKNDTLLPKKSGNFIINFKTNSGLVLNKSLTIKKRIDSISITGFRDLYLSELPLKFSMKSKSGLPVKYSLEYNDQLDLRNDEIINRGLPSSYNKFQSQYVIYVETQGNEEFESIRQMLVFKIKGINDLMSLENQTNKFILYPNPVSENHFKVLYTGTEFISNPNFKLYNNLGKEIEISQINSGNDYIYQLSTQSKTSAGTYFLRISYYSFESSKDENEVKRIIIK